MLGATVTTECAGYVLYRALVIINDLQVLRWCARSCQVYQMELWLLLTGDHVVQRLTPVWKATILVEHRQGHAAKMEGGQAKNQPVSFVNGERGTNWIINSLEVSREIKMNRNEYTDSYFFVYYIILFLVSMLVCTKLTYVSLCAHRGEPSCKIHSTYEF